MAGGRPTEYTPELIEKAKDYLVNYKETYDHTVPTVAGLSIVLDMSRTTMYTWGEDENKKEFSYILRNLKALQENALISRGLDGKFNSTITKLILTKHGYSDKIETDVTSKGNSISRNISDEEKVLYDKLAADIKKLEGLE